MKGTQKNPINFFRGLSEYLSRELDVTENIQWLNRGLPAHRPSAIGLGVNGTLKMIIKKQLF